MLLSGGALACAGCGAKHATAQEQRLERGDLLVVARALAHEAPSVLGEVAATRRAWPLVVDGLPASVSASARARVQLAVARSKTLALRGPFAEHEAASLTGPGSPIAGVFRTFVLLAQRGWRLIGAAIEQIEHGSPAAASFARANAGLYIESVYDGHFDLAQIGKKLIAGYRTLGGAQAFAGALTQPQVNALARAYSEASDRLRPHTGVKFGS